MVSIPKWVQLASHKHPTGTGEPVEPDAHALVQAQHPQGLEIIQHINFPGGNHLAQLPKEVFEGRQLVQCEDENGHDFLETTPQHVIVEAVQEALFGDWVAAPEIMVIVAAASFHEQDQLNKK